MGNLGEDRLRPRMGHADLDNLRNFRKVEFFDEKELEHQLEPLGQFYHCR